MFTYVFVYSPSKFQVDGEHPLKRFEPGEKYESVPAVIEAGNQDLLDPGIYGIWSDPDLPPGLRALESTITVDYDLFSGDKDPWPWLVGPEPDASVDPELRARVCAAFPSLRDEDLKGFFITRGR